MWILWGALSLCALLGVGCMRIGQVMQPAQARPGEVITIQLAAAPRNDFRASESVYGCFAASFPKGWIVQEPVFSAGPLYEGEITYSALMSYYFQHSDFRSGYCWWSGLSQPREAARKDESSTLTLRVKVGRRPGNYKIHYLVGTTSAGFGARTACSMPIRVLDAAPVPDVPQVALNERRRGPVAKRPAHDMLVAAEKGTQLTRP
jgi:hypothetical protein